MKGQYILHLKGTQVSSPKGTAHQSAVQAISSQPDHRLPTKKQLITRIYLNDQLVLDTKDPVESVLHLDDPTPYESVGFLRVEQWTDKKNKLDQGQFSFHKMLNGSSHYQFDRPEYERHRIQLGLRLTLEFLICKTWGFAIPQPSPHFRTSNLQLINYSVYPDFKITAGLPLGYNGPIHLSDYFTSWNEYQLRRAREEKIDRIVCLKIHSIVYGRRLQKSADDTPKYCYTVYYQSYFEDVPQEPSTNSEITETTSTTSSSRSKSPQLEPVKANQEQIDLIDLF